MQTQTPWTWRQSLALIERLAHAQNHEANCNQDILTFVGFCDSEAELLRHVEHYEAQAAAYVAPVRKGRRARVRP